MDTGFREITEDDLELVREIFNYYIIHTTNNYRTVPLSLKDLREIINPGHPKYKSFLITERNDPCGFVYLSQFRNRSAYDRTAEITVYLKPEHCLVLKDGVLAMRTLQAGGRKIRQDYGCRGVPEDH